MNQFKNIFIFGVIILLLVCVMIIQYATPSRTVDFRGEIINVVISENGTVTICAANDYAGEFIFRLDDESKLENCCGEKIAAEDLAEGAIIDVNYRKLLFKEEDVYTVRSLKIYS